jgi:hypothetical protein
MLSQLEQTADSGPELPTDDGCRLSGSYGWTRTIPAKRVSPMTPMKPGVALQRRYVATADQKASTVAQDQGASLLAIRLELSLVGNLLIEDHVDGHYTFPP